MGIHFDADGFANQLQGMIHNVAKNAGEEAIREKLIEGLGPVDAGRVTLTPEDTLDGQIGFRVGGAR